MDSLGIGIGIVGCGGAAADLCDAVDDVAGVRLVAAFDVAEANARALALPRQARVAESLDELVGAAGVDAVYVGLPHHLLAPAAQRALAAGRHVLVEKPVALRVADIDALEAESRERSLQLATMFVVRESDSARRARRLVTAGAIGAVRAIRVETVIDKPPAYWTSGPSGRVVTSWRSRSAEAGGGVLLMNSLHQLDVVRFVTGLDFVSVVAESASFGEAIDVEDVISATFRMTNGAVLALAAASESPGAVAQERIEIDGELGRVDLGDGHERVRVFLRRRWRDYEAGTWYKLVGEHRGLYHGALDSFVAAVRGTGTVTAGAADARAALAAALGAYRAAADGVRVDVRV